MNFANLCILIVVASITISWFLAPILWDAAGAIETILNGVYHVEFTKVGG